MMIMISMMMMLRMIMMMTADLGKMHIGADLVDNAKLLQEKGDQEFYDNNDDDVENDDDDDACSSIMHLVNDANLLQEEDLQGDQPAPELPPPVGLAFAKLSR